jgi:hypothetical protein
MCFRPFMIAPFLVNLASLPALITPTAIPTPDPTSFFVVEPLGLRRGSHPATACLECIPVVHRCQGGGERRMLSLFPVPHSAFPVSPTGISKKTLTLSPQPLTTFPHLKNRPLFPSSHVYIEALDQKLPFPTARRQEVVTPCTAKFPLTAPPAAALIPVHSWFKIFPASYGVLQPFALSAFFAVIRSSLQTRNPQP